MPKSNERVYRAMACMESVKLGDVKEKVSPHAFEDRDMPDATLRYDRQGIVLASARNGSLQLKCDEHGLTLTW